MTVLSILLAVVVIAVLAAALIEVRRGLRTSPTGSRRWRTALETVESEHLGRCARPWRPSTPSST